MFQRILLRLARQPVVRYQSIDVSILLQDCALVGLAKPSSRCDQRVEHALEVEGRTANHLEHVGGGRLLLQGLPQLAEQPRVLYCDDGLAGKVSDQCNLLIGERPNFLTEDVDRADKLTLPHDWYAEQSAIAAKLGAGDHMRSALGICPDHLDVRDMRHLFREGDLAKRAVWMGTKHRLAPPILSIRGWSVVHRGNSEGTPFVKEQRAELGLANSRRVLQHGLEHRLQLARRTADDAEHFRGRSLLL